MALNRIQAKRLLSDREMSLFEGSLVEHASQMSDKDLQAQIRRVRNQRDKFQDLLQRQRVTTRDRTGSKSGPSGVANARTGQKVQVFSEALERLEKQQSRRERAQAGSRRAVGAAAGRPQAGASAGGTSKPGAAAQASRTRSDARDRKRSPASVLPQGRRTPGTTDRATASNAGRSAGSGKTRPARTGR